MIKCNLGRLMGERGYSIQDVSDLTGLSRTTVSDLLNENSKGVQFKTLIILCKLFGVQPNQIFTYVSDKSEDTAQVETSDSSSWELFIRMKEKIIEEYKREHSELN